MRFILIGIYALFLLPSYAVAEIWLCDKESKSVPVFTNTPVASVTTNCTQKETKWAPYTKLSTEAFDRLSEKVGKDDTDPTQADDRRMPSPTKSAHTLRSTFRYREHRPKGHRPFDVECEVSGTAQAAESAVGEIVITRGALTVDRLEVILAPNYEPTKWQILLKGYV